MILLAKPTGAIRSALAYLTGARDCLGRLRGFVELAGNYTTVEFESLVNAVPGPGRCFDQLVIALGEALLPGWRKRIFGILDNVLGHIQIGIPGGIPYLAALHGTLEAGIHMHLLLLRLHLGTGLKFSSLPFGEDLKALRLLQTEQNILYGSSDPFDPAHSRRLAYFPIELPIKIRVVAAEAQNALRRLIATGSCKTDEAYACLRALKFNATLRDGIVSLVFDRREVAITTRAFDRDLPPPVPPHGPRPWFTSQDKDQLRLYRLKRQLRHMRKYHPANRPLYMEPLLEESDIHNARFLNQHESTDKNQSLSVKNGPHSGEPGEQGSLDHVLPSPQLRDAERDAKSGPDENVRAQNEDASGRWLSEFKRRRKRKPHRPVDRAVAATLGKPADDPDASLGDSAALDPGPTEGNPATREKQRELARWLRSTLRLLSQVLVLLESNPEL